MRFVLFVLFLGYVFVLFVLFVRVKSFRKKNKNKKVWNCPNGLIYITTNIDKVKFKIYDVETWETIAMPILPNISRSKGNQSMELIEWLIKIECDMKNIFLEKSCLKCGGKTIPWAFSKNSRLSKFVPCRTKYLERIREIQ